ncbi:MAG: hypothetical protein IKV71_00295, partial [Psychrobacter sp.]|nr:hypothetical protein [Psychrobacter sp.]
GYLRQARKQLQTLVPQTSTPKTISTDNKTSPTASSTTATKDKNKVQTKSSPNDITEVIDWLDRLIANAPKSTPLLTKQILDKPKR